MHRDSNISAICRLINDPLLHFRKTEADKAEEEAVSLTKKEEKDLLIALSQVLTAIRLSTSELLCDSIEVKIGQPEEKCSEESTLHLHGHNCLTKILADLMYVLTVNNQFLQHLVCNILVAVSEFLAVLGDQWGFFIRLLCICLELGIADAMGNSVIKSINGDEDDSYCVLEPRLKNASWSTAAGIVLVLHNVFKHLKQECDDDLLLEMYLASIGSFLSKMNWDFMDEICIGGDRQDAAVCEMEGKVLFLGNFVQLLCSLVEQSGGMEVEDDVGSQEQTPFVSLIIDIVPKLLCSCLGNQRNCVKASFIPYFRHKLLMLMLRLSYQTCLAHSTIVLWLQLLHDYFEDLLLKPIMEPESGQDDCLEGSPFLLSLSIGESQNVHSLHLQRQAVLLLLRCCFSLVSLSTESSKECGCATLGSYLHLNSVADMDCCSKKKGFLELYKWLQRHLPTDFFVDHEVYVETCKSFASSFLQLFVNEDNALFKVLLQLLSISSNSDKRLDGEWAILDVKYDIVFHVSSLFNPVNLFHIFLDKLHFDHQVLLDYLISKDTGLSCAEYLLRCLRIVCDSWSLFVKFSVDDSSMNQSTCKKRKLFLDGSRAQVEPLVVSVKHVPPPVEEKRKGDIDNDHEHYKIKSQSFKEAKHCLLSLKDSLESLHKKHLFPYNPEMLLKRREDYSGRPQYGWDQHICCYGEVSGEISASVFASAFMYGPDVSLTTIRDEYDKGLDSYMDSQFTFSVGPSNPPTTLLLGPNFLSAKLYQLSPPEVKSTFLNNNNLGRH